MQPNLTIPACYETALHERGIVPDASQRAVLRQCAALTETLESTIGRLLRQLHVASSPQGLYLWGGVGRGKTLLMDLFFQHLGIVKKKRMHFHDFMHTMHESLRALDGHKNPLIAIAKQWRRECDVLCLDECTVDDVADAMILGELLTRFFKSGIVLITTSNTRPDKLYEKGVQRQRFLVAIEAIQTYCHVMHVDNGEDYRHRTLTHDAMHLKASDTQQLETLFHQLATGPVTWHHTIIVDERPIMANAMAHRMIWFEFNAICRTYRSTPDYLKLVKQFDTFFITHVPMLFEKDTDAVRRFVHLIDVLYDNHVRLVFSAEADVDMLYQGKLLKPEFQRTQSRLTEMMHR